MCDILILIDARVELKNKDGKTALDLAKDPATAAMLKRAGEWYINKVMTVVVLDMSKY